MSLLLSGKTRERKKQELSPCVVSWLPTWTSECSGPGLEHLGSSMIAAAAYLCTSCDVRNVILPLLFKQLPTQVFYLLCISHLHLCLKLFRLEHVITSLRVKSYFFKKIIFSIIDIDIELLRNMNVYIL